MIPKILHYISKSDLNNQSILRLASARCFICNDVRVEIDNGLEHEGGRKFDRSCSVIHWSTGKIISSARLFGQPHIEDGLLNAISRKTRMDLAILFILDSMGGYFIDAPVGVTNKVLEITNHYDFFTVEGAAGFPSVGLDFIGARPGVRSIAKASDRVMRGIFDYRYRVPTEVSLGKAIVEESPIRNSMHVTKKQLLDKLTERQDEDSNVLSGKRAYVGEYCGD